MQEILQKAKKKYCKEKAAEYYLKNKKALKGKSKNWYKNFSKEEKGKLKSIKEKDISNHQYSTKINKALQSKQVFFSQL